MLNMLFDYTHHSLVASAGVSQGQSDDWSCNNGQIDGSDGLVVDLGDIVHQIVHLVDFIQWIFIDKPNQLRNLTWYELFCGSHLIPHN
jgi:hypothetical protein